MAVPTSNLVIVFNVWFSYSHAMKFRTLREFRSFASLRRIY